MSAEKKPQFEPITVRPEDAARMIGFGLSKLYELIRKGEIRAFKVGRTTLIEVVELKRWIEKQKAAA